MIKIFDNPWDSDFFKIRTGSISTDESTFSSELESNMESATKRYKLLYVTADTNDISILGEYQKYCTYVDERIVFSKQIRKSTGLDFNVSELSSNIEYNKLFELAYTCGGMSRFKMDEYFPESKFKGLYREMIYNSLKSENGTVLVYDEKDYKGIVTINKGDIARIGLLGVRPDSQGLGIGMSLLNAADRFCHRNGWDRLEVLTQAINVGAIKLYEKCGYKEIKRNCIFHLWL